MDVAESTVRVVGVDVACGPVGRVALLIALPLFVIAIICVTMQIILFVTAIIFCVTLYLEPCPEEGVSSSLAVSKGLVYRRVVSF